MIVLANLTRRGYALEEPPEYVVYQGPMYGESRQYWATVHIYGRDARVLDSYRKCAQWPRIGGLHRSWVLDTQHILVAPLMRRHDG